MYPELENPSAKTVPINVLSDGPPSTLTILLLSSSPSAERRGGNFIPGVRPEDSMAISKGDTCAEA